MRPKSRRFSRYRRDQPRVAPLGSDRRIEIDDAEGQRDGADVGKAGAVAGFRRILGRDPGADRGRQVGVGVAVARDQPADPRQQSREIPLIELRKTGQPRRRELEDGQPSAGLEDAQALGARRRRVARRCGCRRRWSGRRRSRWRAAGAWRRRGPARRRRRGRAARPWLPVPQHGAGEVDADDPRRPAGPGQRDTRSAVPVQRSSDGLAAGQASARTARQRQ